MIFSKKSAENQYLTDYNSFIDSLVPTDLLLEIEYESDSVANHSYFCIKHNDVIVNNFVIIKEVSNLIMRLVPSQGPQVLELCMTGKGPNDTLVENGNIVKDTFLKLKNLKINNYTLLDDYDFFFNKAEYIRHADDAKMQPMTGFWDNASLKIVFDLPFDLWYNSVSTKNAAISESLKFRAANDLDSLIKDLEQSLKKLI